jgi:hypothetical protein
VQERLSSMLCCAELCSELCFEGHEGGICVGFMHLRVHGTCWEQGFPAVSKSRILV